VPLTKKCVVCSAHFREEDVITNDTFIINGQVVLLPRQKAKLKVGAIPVIFPGYPAYFQPVTRKRKAPLDRTGRPTRIRKLPMKNEGNHKAPEIDILKEQPVEETFSAEAPEIDILKEQPVEEAFSAEAREIDILKEQPVEEAFSAEAPEIDILKEQPVEETFPAEELPGPSNAPPAVSGWSHCNASELNLPSDWFIYDTLSTEKTTLVHMDPTTNLLDKSIEFEGEAPPIVRIRGRIPAQYGAATVANIEEAQKLLIEIDKAKVCQGTGFATKPYHDRCNGQGMKKYCVFCYAERRKLKARNLRARLKSSKKMAIIKEKQKIPLKSMKRSKTTLLLKVSVTRRRTQFLCISN